MAKEIFFNAARSQEIEDTTITSGLVDAGGNLILKARNGVEQNAGYVRGPKGDDSRFPIPYDGATSGYIRLVTMDGLDASNGANYNAFLSGLGDIGQLKRTTILFHATQRGSDLVDLKAWGWDLQSTDIKLYARKRGPFLYEIWLKVPSHMSTGSMTELASWRTIRNLDNFTTTAPSDLVEATIVSATDNTTFKTGILEATYRAGKARVKIDGVLSSEAYSWMNRYDPLGSREVGLMRTASGWVITGQKEDGYARLEYGSNWSSYSDNAGNWSGGAKAIRLPSGIVVLKGMLLSRSTPTDGQLIVTLPPGFRPDTDGLFPVEMGESARTVRIAQDGRVYVFGSGWPTSWLSLDGIAFPSAGIANWAPIGTLGTSWGPSFGKDASWVAQFGEPSIWKDPYGFVWYRGLVKVLSTVSGDNVPIINMPAELRVPTSRAEHIRGTGNNAYAGLGGNSDIGLVWKPNSPSAVGLWISLGGVITKTADAYSLNPWPTKTPRLINGFNPFNTDNTQPNYLLREDGLRVLTGLLGGGGTGGKNVWRFPEKEMFAEDGHLTIPLMAVNARGRLTINPSWLDGDNDRGALYINSVTEGWCSIDNRVYMP